VKDGAGCSTKEKGYIEKMSSKPVEDLQKNLTRLENMDPKAMKAELGDWLIKRKKILKALVAEGSDEL